MEAQREEKGIDSHASSQANAFPSEPGDFENYPPHSVAVIGMAGRFPEADSVDELWELLLEGRSTVKRADEERLQLSQGGNSTNTNWWGNWIRDPTSFDHRFFKKSSREAVAWDPQQRILLEVIYEALESSGYFGPLSDSTSKNDYGCYIGAVMNSYEDNLACYPPTTYATLGTGRCFLSGYMSHHFGWTGPALTIDTACSSSLVAINSACRAIWSGECSQAIAGGTNVISSPGDYHNLNTVGFLSPTGQCKPFDASADGYCRGEGVAVVVLKKLSNAIKDNDHILGVITGSVVNQNHGVSHITMPNSDSHVDLYRKVLNLGNTTADAVTYVEAHGTGTTVGDPIEVRGIRDAYGGPQRSSTLHFASIKGNIGHLEATAGVSGLIKVLLMMRHGKIPQQASYNQLNPKIPSLRLDNMAIPTTILPWDAPVRLACVNSHGAAGSNSAVLVREKPRLRSSVAQTRLKSYPLILTAGSPSSLSSYATKLLEWLRQGSIDSAARLAALTFTLADRANHTLPFNFAASVTDVNDLTSKLKGASSGSDINTVAGNKPVVLVFGGQETDFIGISKDVFQASNLFRSHIDHCNSILVARGLESLYPAIFETEPLKNLTTLHSALFAVQYASAMSWRESGLRIDGVVGQSFGQLTAFCISGCLSLSDTLTLVVKRASLMQQYWGKEPGAMISVQSDSQTLQQRIESFERRDGEFYAEIACYNSPKSHVVVGDSKSVMLLEQDLLSSAIRTQRLSVTHGFHSKFTEPMLPHLLAVAKELDWRRPVLHLETCHEDGNAVDPGSTSISELTRQPVFFCNAVRRLQNRFPQLTWIESGRGSSVLQLVQASLLNEDGQTFLSPQLRSPNAQCSLTDRTVELWRSGYAAQYWMFHRCQKLEYEYLSLPPYQFDKAQHWLPYIPRAPKDGLLNDEAVREPHEPQLISFVQFNDGSKTEALFRVDPCSDRFQTLAGGHAMAGQPLLPASLYFEIISRAALFLQIDAETEGYLPAVENLAMKYPIGQDTATEIQLLLKHREDVRPTWDFIITTKSRSHESAEYSQQSSGRVCLKKRSDAQAAREFGRYESVTGYRRYEDVLNNRHAEKMQGKHVYRAFSLVVDYAEMFRGITEIACVGREAAGRVVMNPDQKGSWDQRLCDTPTMDSLMQFAGFLVNYFNNPNLDELFLCMYMEHVELGGSFDPDAQEWIVYAVQREAAENEAAADIYVFEAKSKKMVMAVFGCRFMQLRRAVLGQILKDLNCFSTSKEEIQVPKIQAKEEETAQIAPGPPSTATSQSSGKREDLFRILSSVTDLPIQEIETASTLEELGIDSLMATEVISDVRTKLNLNIDLTTFLSLPTIVALVDYINEALGIGIHGLMDTPRSQDTDQLASPSLYAKPEFSVPSLPENVNRPILDSAMRDFEDVRLEYDRLASGTKATGFWSEAYPHQSRLVLAYVVEAFAEIGCDLTSLQSGDPVPKVHALDKHRLLVRQLHRVLEDGKLISSMGHGFVRTGITIDTTPAATIYHQMIDLYPQHSDVNNMVQIVGSRLGSCLAGKVDGLQVIFGDKKAKKTLESMYEFWPLLRTATLVLGDFLLKAFANATGGGKFRILEVGAGTGGTTRYIINHLRSHNIPFEYVFTDVSSSLVATAKRQLKGAEDLSFEVLDIEKSVDAKHEGAFHVIIATNCVHATRNLETSLSNLRKMLREDGALTLVEATRNMFWLDIVVGLLEGWWLFEDDRSHALVDENHWKRVLKASGFGQVMWSDGASPESKTMRVIAAFAREYPEQAVISSSSAAKVGYTLETVAYKRLDEQEVLADIYYPIDRKNRSKRLPIGEQASFPAAWVPANIWPALMIHGGSHVLFSRKSIRPAQTDLLLQKGFIPVSLDHRLCPEVSLVDGPMVDVCDALEWARHKLPALAFREHALEVDGDTVVVVGWSSGGQLAMSLGWTAHSKGLRPPDAVLAFYSPTWYEDEWWQHSIQPIGAADPGDTYDVLEGVQDQPITTYSLVEAWEPLSDSRIHADPRCRIVLHMNWKAQTLPVILGGLPSRKMTARNSASNDWNALPQPASDKIAAASVRTQVHQGNYMTPTFLIHGTNDDLIPWEQSQGTYEAMVENNVPAQLVLVQGAPHVCDLSSDPDSAGWKATLRGYEFLASYAFRE